MKTRARNLRILSGLLLATTLAGCLSVSFSYGGSESSDERIPTLVGAELEYVFPTGRRYQAHYTEATVHFELLEPVLPDPPSKTWPYRVQALRDGVYFVVWEDPEYQPVFVIDLVTRQVHTRAVREEDEILFLTAEIVSLSYPPIDARP